MVAENDHGAQRLIQLHVAKLHHYQITADVKYDKKARP